jgi:ATP/maltotriose-dependent transcriptional regulator MalT
MPTREELVEALHHATETRARLAKVPGQHGQRALVLNLIDDLLDELAEVDDGQASASQLVTQ